MGKDQEKLRAPRNRTVTLTDEEIAHYRQRLVKISADTTLGQVECKTVHQDLFEILDMLPSACVDLLFLDPPYNLTKSFNEITFYKRTVDWYVTWFESWFSKLVHILKPTASVYICGDWHSSAAIHSVAEKYLIIRNRITWEREKGRGAKRNWKNCSEDVWFCTVSENYTFNVDAVKIKRKVIAPYKDDEGKPKDWEQDKDGNYRLTHPSNLWTDLTVPFWSMPENTDHPTQKPEKMLAKIILASSNQDDLILDPFLGSGTTSVVAKKLGRRFIGIEVDEQYCCLAEKRIALAQSDKNIQGYSDGVFWERNTFQIQQLSTKTEDRSVVLPLFPEFDE